MSLLDGALTVMHPEHPVMKAWSLYKQTERYKNTLKWASSDEHSDEHREGSLWAVFFEGYQSSDVEQSKGVVTYSLTALRQATDEIIDSSSVSAQFNEPINWADLHCREASYVQIDDGREYYRVMIEEAAPECVEFCEHIAKRLAERGFENVGVVTEW